MANLRGTARKIQTALLYAGQKVKVETRQFYSKEQNRMINKYTISTPVWNEKKGKHTDCEVLSTCSMPAMVKKLAEMYEAVRSG